MPSFAKGAEKAKAAAESGTPKIFLVIKPGERVILRPLTDMDEWIPIDIHMGVPTKKAPKGVNADKWPSQMSAVCRNADAFRIRDEDDVPTDVYEADDKGRLYGDCYIHANMSEVLGKYKKPVSRTVSQTWGMFVLREEVRNDQKKLVGFRDVMEQFKDKDGHVHNIPKIVIASQTWGNFWAPLNSAGSMTDTVCDRDFAVERVENDYIITAGRETPDHHPGTASWQRYLDAMALTGLSVEKELVRQASVEYYGRFFDPAWKDEDADEGSDDAGDSAEVTLSDDEAEKLKAKMAASFAETQPT